VEAVHGRADERLGRGDGAGVLISIALLPSLFLGRLILPGPNHSDSATFSECPPQQAPLESNTHAMIEQAIVATTRAA
jgi:hypothetical protein